jgi:hypothetical protein
LPEIHQTIRILLATLSYPLFEPVSQSGEGRADVRTYYCRGPDTDGRAEYTSEGMVVKRGSTGRRETVPSYPDRAKGVREELIAQGIVTIQGNHLRFESDHVFKSPSAASVFLLGRPSNGWTEWVDAQGRSLDAMERQSRTPHSLPEPYRAFLGAPVISAASLAAAEGGRCAASNA